MYNDYVNEKGICPNCKEHSLNYGAIELEGEAVYFPYECKDCGLQGEEWYSLEFLGHNIYNEEGECIEL